MSFRAQAHSGASAFVPWPGCDSTLAGSLVASHSFVDVSQPQPPQVDSGMAGSSRESKPAVICWIFERGVSGGCPRPRADCARDLCPHCRRSRLVEPGIADGADLPRRPTVTSGSGGGPTPISRRTGLVDARIDATPVSRGTRLVDAPIALRLDAGNSPGGNRREHRDPRRNVCGRSFLASCRVHRSSSSLRELHREGVAPGVLGAAR